jgi:hypothetical protein
MDWVERLAEKRILQAQEEGAFDDLPGRGVPLPPDKFARLHPEFRLVARVLANSGYAPEEVGLLRALNESRKRLDAVDNDDERTGLMREHNRAELKYNIAMERHKRLFR